MSNIIPVGLKVIIEVFHFSLLIYVQHHGKTVENGPDRIVFIKAESLTASGSYHRTELRSIQKAHHVFCVDFAFYDPFDGAAKPVLG